MPLDSTRPAASLLAHSQEISQIEQQNRFGGRHQTISEIPTEKHLTVWAIQTPGKISPELFNEILHELQSTYGFEGIQIVFADAVPNFGPEYRCDLHLTAHLRAERVDF